MTNTSNPAGVDADGMPCSSSCHFPQHRRTRVKAKECYYLGGAERCLFDGLSGLWCLGQRRQLGRGNHRPEIQPAITQQLGRVAHCPPFQLRRSNSFHLAPRLAQLAPKPHNHVFYCNSDSEAANTSRKTAAAYWPIPGKAEKILFVGKAKHCHGVHYGGTGEGGIANNRCIFGQEVAAPQLSHPVLPQAPRRLVR